MPPEEILCVSYFDNIIGPNTFYCNEDLSNSHDYPDLRRVLEFNDEEGTFIFAFREYQTVNHIFFIPSDYARGGKELVMISYMIRAEYFRSEISDVFSYLESRTPILEDFAKIISNLEEFIKILHENKKFSENENLIELGTQNFKDKFQAYFNDTFNDISVKKGNRIFQSQENLKKIFILGAQEIGKTTFLRNIEAMQFYQQDRNDLPTKFFEVVIDNMEILMDECLESNFKCNQCEKKNRCVNNAQGFILIFNASENHSVIEAKEKYKIILNKFCKNKPKEKIPVLLIGNKFKKSEAISAEYIDEMFDLKKKKECNVIIKYYPMNLLKDEVKVIDALRWLTRNMI